MKRNVAIGIIAGVLVCGLLSALITTLLGKSRYYMDVKYVSWTTTINIGEYQSAHYEGWCVPPEDAYNIEKSRRFKRFVKHGDSDVAEYDTWYEYDVNQWKYKRCLVNRGSDKNPVYPECTLFLVDKYHEDVLGNEKVLSKYTEYEAAGICTDLSDSILIYDVPYDIWMELTTYDWISFDKTKIGKAISNVELHPLGDGVK